MLSVLHIGKSLLLCQLLLFLLLLSQECMFCCNPGMLCSNLLKLFVELFPLVCNCNCLHIRNNVRSHWSLAVSESNLFIKNLMVCLRLCHSKCIPGVCYWISNGKS